MFGLREEDAEIVDFVGDVLALVTFCGREQIATFKGRVKARYWQMWDEYEFGRADVSQYDYNVDEIVPESEYDYKIVLANGKLQEGDGNTPIKIVKIIEENLEKELI